MARRKRVLAAATRRRLGFRPPMGAATEYRRLISGWFGAWHKRLLAQLLDGWETNPAHFTGAIAHRADAAASDYVVERIGPLRTSLEQAIKPESDLSRSVRVLAARVNKHNALEFRRVIGVTTRELGISDAALDSFRDYNVGLIKSLAERELDEITEILENAEKSALRVETLADELAERFGVTESKASLLARDQTLKFNGQLTQTRQKGAGITHYVWTTSGDERVREMHAELDGTIHSWDTPPVVSPDGRTEHPGGDYQCRCTAFPIVAGEYDNEGPEFQSAVSNAASIADNANG